MIPPLVTQGGIVSPQLLAAINGLLREQAAESAMLGSGGMVATVLPGIRAIADGRLQFSAVRFPAQVVAKGPNNEDDYTDARYWLKTVYAKQTLSQSDDPATTIVSLQTSNFSDSQLCFTATNMAEIGSSSGGTGSTASHLVPTDGSVFVWVDLIEGVGTGGDGYEQFVFCHDKGGDVRACRVKQTGGADGGVTTVATWSYDCFDIADATCTGSAFASGVAATASAARILTGPVTKAPDNSTALAMRVSATTWELMVVKEVHSEGPCVS